jgi:polyhydroxyalkanoate synthesis regulator phasin
LQIPGQAQGDEVKHLPVDLGKLYDEARYCVSVNSFTASVLVCRKILLHLAVNKGAPTGQKFEEAVDYLVSKGYVPPDGKEWVDTIRKKGNEANHEIKLMNKTDAVELISFIEMLLKFMYEFPAKVKKSP